MLYVRDTRLKVRIRAIAELASRLTEHISANSQTPFFSC